MLMKEYRGVEYEIHHRDEKRWEWICYPNREKNAPMAGRVDGTHEDAVAACQAVIDTFLTARSK